MTNDCLRFNKDKFIPYRLTSKCILVGDAGVGKSSILQCILGKQFNPHIYSTIGVEFGATTLPLSKTVGPEPRAIKLQIWDAAGQERFRSIVQSYYRNTAVVILVFDLTDITSLDNLNFWIGEIKRIRGIEEGWPLFYLVGNKSDLGDADRRVFPEHIETLSKTNPIRAYREVSARDGTMIGDLMQEIVDDVDQLLPNEHHVSEKKPYPGITFESNTFGEVYESVGGNRHNRAASQCC